MKKVDAWRTADGSVFTDEAEALAHENAVSFAHVATEYCDHRFPDAGSRKRTEVYNIVCEFLSWQAAKTDVDSKETA